MRTALLLSVALAFIPGTALAHTVMMDPPPRDSSDAHKSGPCGGVARTPYCVSYDAGATIPVKWKETVDHTGCFQIAVSKGNDQNFTILKQVQDLSGTGGMVYPDSVTLPANFTCKDCTIVVRQLMLGRACNGNGTTGPFEDIADAGPTGVYYSCGDIRVGDPTPCESPDAGTETDASAPEEDASTPPPSSGEGDAAAPGLDTPTGNRVDNSADTAGGCSTTGGATSGFALVGITAFGLALARRRSLHRK